MASEPLPIARTADGRDIALLPAMANRHGLVTGATGTGKTVTLQVLAERFSAIGVPVFVADVKGDLSGIAAAGSRTPKIDERLRTLQLPEPQWRGVPVQFWDVFGERGYPVRATISDMGPLLLGRLLGLNETQQGVLAVTFKAADEAGLPLLDLKDLRAMLKWVSDHAREVGTEYGHVSAASVGAIQRGLLSIEEQGGDRFFGEPMLDIHDLIELDAHGRGIANVLAAEKLIQAPALYSTFLLWLLAELFEQLEELGDPEKPRLVFFFDEAHLLFDEASRPLVEKIEQVVRLIRSKGVGVYFVTQNPGDLPDEVLGQLGNRIHHALRAATPKEQRAVRSAADTLRPNPKIDAVQVMGELAVGEALISLLDESGSPRPVERAWMLPPGSRIGPLPEPERDAIRAKSAAQRRYEEPIDRESAYEKLKQRAEQGATAAGAPPKKDPAAAGSGGLSDVLFGSTGPRGGRREGMVEAAAKSAARTVGSTIGREIIRGIFGSMLGGRRRR
jgi:DNA double-strand break repair helicase HerA and related ATPase